MDFLQTGISDLLQQWQIGLPIVIMFGLVFGSFATMASYRIPRGEDIILKPSSCPSCSHKLGLPDLFPVLSWILNYGKCKYCKAAVSMRYPLTEIAMASLFSIIYLKLGISFATIALFGLTVCLVIMIVTDLEHRIIPDSIQIAILFFGIIYRFALDSEIYQYFSGALFGLCFAITLRYGFWLWKKREGLGMGDVKFFAGAGMFLGIKAFIPFLFFSGLLGIVFSFFWKKAGGEEEFPFGPSLAASMFFCLVFPEYAEKIFYY